ncbi:MAG: hypothetical protein RL518_2143 [Pseudomonadota bacterium]
MNRSVIRFLRRAVLATVLSLQAVGTESVVAQRGGTPIPNGSYVAMLGDQALFGQMVHLSTTIPYVSCHCDTPYGGQLASVPGQGTEDNVTIVLKPPSTKSTSCPRSITIEGLASFPRIFGIRPTMVSGVLYQNPLTNEYSGIATSESSRGKLTVSLQGIRIIPRSDCPPSCIRDGTCAAGGASGGAAGKGSSSPANGSGTGGGASNMNKVGSGGVGPSNKGSSCRFEDKLEPASVCKGTYKQECECVCGPSVGTWVCSPPKGGGAARDANQGGVGGIGSGTTGAPSGCCPATQAWCPAGVVRCPPNGGQANPPQQGNGTGLGDQNQGNGPNLPTWYR